ncbi:hypothetical protein NPIL_659631, partial [Nephila pilipes]
SRYFEFSKSAFTMIIHGEIVSWKIEKRIVEKGIVAKEEVMKMDEGDKIPLTPKQVRKELL